MQPQQSEPVRLEKEDATFLLEQAERFLLPVRSLE